MALVNYLSHEIQFKVVYYGTGLGGKTTNLMHIHAKTPQQYRGNLVSLKTDEERTLYFDFLPVALGVMDTLKSILRGGLHAFQDENRAHAPQSFVEPVKQRT